MLESRIASKRQRLSSPIKRKLNAVISTSGTTRVLEDLPIEILVNIFARLCYRDLATIELVSKSMGRIAQLVWQSIESIDLNELILFGVQSANATHDEKMDEERRRQDPRLVIRALGSILCKTSEKKLRRLNLSDYPVVLGSENARCFQWIGERCSQLTSLSLSKHKIKRGGHLHPFSLYHFSKMVRSLSHLKSIDLRYCPVNDSSVKCIFENCHNLELIDISYCKSLTGKCFENVDKLRNLHTILLNYCVGMHDTHLIDFLGTNGPYITQGFYASSSGSTKFTNALYDAIVSNLTNVARLSVTCLQPEHSDHLHTMENLVELDLNSSEANNRAFALILNKCLKLKSLNLSWCPNLSDQAFDLYPINAKLESLDLSYDSSVTDVTLRKLAEYLASSLRELKLAYCLGMTGEGVLEFVKVTRRLSLLNASNLNDVDNEFVDELVAMENLRAVPRVFVSCVCCPHMDVERFLAGKSGVSRRLMRGIMYEIEWRNFVFEIDIWDETENETEELTEEDEEENEFNDDD